MISKLMFLLKLVLLLSYCKNTHGNNIEKWCTSDYVPKDLRCAFREFNPAEEGSVNCKLASRNSQKDDYFCYSFFPDPEDAKEGIPVLRGCITKNKMCKSRNNVISENCLRRDDIHYTSYDVWIPGGKICFCDKDLCNDDGKYTRHRYRYR